MFGLCVHVHVHVCVRVLLLACLLAFEPRVFRRSVRCLGTWVRGYMACI